MPATTPAVKPVVDPVIPAGAKDSSVLPEIHIEPVSSPSVEEPAPATAAPASLQSPEVMTDVAGQPAQAPQTYTSAFDAPKPESAADAHSVLDTKAPDSNIPSDLRIQLPADELRGQNPTQKAAPAIVAEPPPATKKKAALNLNFNVENASNSFMAKLNYLHVSLEERVLFARQLSVGVKAGLSMQDSLMLLRSQTKSPSMKKILSAIVHDTANGMYLSASLENYKNIFGQLFINIVRVGEQTGTLIENLNYLAEELKKKQELVSRVRGALIYPAVIMVATIGIVVTLIVGVFPKILPVFTSLNIKLPLTTRILIATTHILTTYTLWIGLGLVALIITFILLSRQEWFKNFFDHALLRLPILSSIAMKVNLVNITRVLGLLLKSGVQIIEAVNITADALDNRFYRYELKVAGETLRRGEFFSVHLAKNTMLFPPIFTNMIQVGENTGNLSENLAYLASYYEEDVDNFLKNLNSIIEPVLLLFMGLLVGFMALSVITPIYQISQTLTR